jgi:AcrR family transcriptional regulator
MNVQLDDICGKREAILNSTLSLVRKNGFHGAPMSQIAREAGVAAGTIYHYFESKESLINALYVHETTKLASSLLRDDDESLPYKQRFIRCMMNHYNYYLENEDSLYFLEQFAHSPYAKKIAEYAPENRFEAVSSFFEFGKRNNHIKNIDSRLLAPTIKGTLAAAANFQLSQHMVFTQEDIMEVINIIWDGIKKQ